MSDLSCANRSKASRQILFREEYCNEKSIPDETNEGSLLALLLSASLRSRGKTIETFDACALITAGYECCGSKTQEPRIFDLSFCLSFFFGDLEAFYFFRKYKYIYIILYIFVYVISIKLFLNLSNISFKFNINILSVFQVLTRLNTAAGED